MLQKDRLRFLFTNVSTALLNSLGIKTLTCFVMFFGFLLSQVTGNCVQNEFVYDQASSYPS